MRMQRLFRDLDIQFEAEQLRALENQAQRRARMEYMAVTMRGSTWEQGKSQWYGRDGS